MRGKGGKMKGKWIIGEGKRRDVVRREIMKGNRGERMTEK